MKWKSLRLLLRIAKFHKLRKVMLKAGLNLWCWTFHRLLKFQPLYVVLQVIVRFLPCALFIPNSMVNFASQSHSCWLTGTQQTFGTRASGVIDPSDIPSPPSFCRSLSDLGNRLSSIARDVEELTIGQPQTSRGINVSTQTSGAIRVT